MLVEHMVHMGYEIKHGNRLSFRFRGQKNFMYPEGKNAKYSEEGIRAAIYKNLRVKSSCAENEKR